MQPSPVARVGSVPVKETSASLSGPSSWMLSLSDLELPLDRFMFRKYWPHLCLPASFLSRFSLALRFWNQTWEKAGKRQPSAPQAPPERQGRVFSPLGQWLPIGPHHSQAMLDSPTLIFSNTPHTAGQEHFFLKKK